MGFTPRVWHDGEPVSGADLTRLEQGIYEAQATADGLFTNVEQVVATVLGSLLPESYLITSDNHLIVTRADGIMVDAGQLQIPGLTDAVLQAEIAAYLAAHPNDTAEPLLAAHITDLTPHPAYDDNMPDLAALYQNRIA